jgi:hypothetical protein
VLSDFRYLILLPSIAIICFVVFDQFMFGNLLLNRCLSHATLHYTDSDYLPSFCSCVDADNYASTLNCSVNLLDTLEVGLIGQFSPCALPATVSLDISTFTPI